MLDCLALISCLFFASGLNTAAVVWVVGFFFLLHGFGRLGNGERELRVRFSKDKSLIVPLRQRKATKNKQKNHKKNCEEWKKGKKRAEDDVRELTGKEGA